MITDLLVHLAQEQMEKKASKVIEGEKLDLLIGNRPIDSAAGEGAEAEKDAIKANVLRLLKDKYGMDEDDLRDGKYIEKDRDGNIVAQGMYILGNRVQ